MDSSPNSATASAQDGWRRTSGIGQLGHGEMGPRRRPMLPPDIGWFRDGAARLPQPPIVLRTVSKPPVERVLGFRAWPATCTKRCPTRSSTVSARCTARSPRACASSSDAVIRTEVDDDELRTARAEIEAITERLRKRQMDGAFGVRFNADGRQPRLGQRRRRPAQPDRPAADIVRDPAGRASADFHLGAAYEGPPGLVHGGVAALILDQILGEAAGAGGKPGMTGTLTLRYRRARRSATCAARPASTGSRASRRSPRRSLGDADGRHRRGRGRVHPAQVGARGVREARRRCASDRFD